MSTQTNVNISFVALSNTDYSVLKVAAGLLEKSAIKAEILEKGDITGTIVLVDVDTEIGQDFCSHFNQGHSQTMLLISTEMLNDQRHSFLKKPVRVQTLKDALHDTFVNLAPKSFVSKSKAQDTSLAMDLNNTLFFHLLKAHQEKQVAQIFCPPYSPLFVHSIQGIVATSSSRQGLRQMLTNQTMPAKSTRLSDFDFEILAKGQLIMSLPHLLWSAALYGSHGQLIEGHSASTPVKLKMWPNLSRLDFEPEHLRLAALMAKHVLTLRQIEQKTQLSWHTISGFYNACCATGLMIINPGTIPVHISTKETIPVKVGLFAKIAQRLRFAS